MIRLITVMGHGSNLLHNFIKHYKNIVDEINIVVYETDIEPFLLKNIHEIVSNYDFPINISYVRKYQIYDWEMVTSIYNYHKMKKPNDWWVVADIDEFHIYSIDLKSMIVDCEENGYDLIRGGFIDRVGNGGLFNKINQEIDIFEQFPMAGFFRYPLSGACPNKICVMKGYVELSYGQHYAVLNGETTWRHRGWSHPLIAPYELYNTQVHHFKWDQTVVERLKSVADMNQEKSYSDEYLKMYKSLKKTNFNVDITNENFMFEHIGNGQYKNWNKLLKKIVSI